jgi:hypothetical protein
MSARTSRPLPAAPILPALSTLSTTPDLTALRVRPSLPEAAAPKPAGRPALPAIQAEPASAPPPVAGDDAIASSLADPRRRDAVEAPFVKAKFQSLVLVCGQCEKRGSGPSKLTAKDARKTIKGALGGQRARMRIVQCSCLGLCPKKSIAIAAAGADMPALLAAARNERDLREIAARLGRGGQRD